MPAAVVLPEHLHLLMILPGGDADYSSRVRRMKSLFVGVLKANEAPLRFNARREADVWQRRFWEHLIRDEADFAAHVDYIHANPLKHGLVERVSDWPLSSFHRYVQRGCCQSIGLVRVQLPSTGPESEGRPGFHPGYSLRGWGVMQSSSQRSWPFLRGRRLKSPLAHVWERGGGEGRR
ncbi:MAG TPA: hypothetical protein VLF16_00620 [Pseudomonas sp.]|nr:hypothetical protein [Pseudomonas sp.]